MSACKNSREEKKNKKTNSDSQRNSQFSIFFSAPVERSVCVCVFFRWCLLTVQKKAKLSGAVFSVNFYSKYQDSKNSKVSKSFSNDFFVRKKKFLHFSAIPKKTLNFAKIISGQFFRFDQK